VGSIVVGKRLQNVVQVVQRTSLADQSEIIKRSKAVGDGILCKEGTEVQISSWMDC
jgi:hypothetical protein